MSIQKKTIQIWKRRDLFQLVPAIQPPNPPIIFYNLYFLRFHAHREVLFLLIANLPRPRNQLCEKRLQSFQILPPEMPQAL
jgi:hypothetical protein